MNPQITKMNESEKFKEYYKEDSITDNYDKQREGNIYRKQKRQKELQIFLKLLNKKDGEKVLEIGCSSGFLTEQLGEVTAIDTSKNMLKIAQQKNLKATVLEADMFKLPFKNNSFDKVITMRVWNHLNKEDLKKALKEVRRVLKPNGILVFDIEEKNWLRRFINFFYKRIFEVTGFKVHQYGWIEIQMILYDEDFSLDAWKLLEHKIGKQIVLKCKTKKLI